MAEIFEGLPGTPLGMAQLVNGPEPYIPYVFQLVDAIKGLHYWTILSRVEVAATTLFLYDYVLTLGMEIDLVWFTKWNFIKVLYLVQRYMPFLDAGAITIYRHAGANFTRRQCHDMTSATAVLTIAGAIASEILLTIRVWALWKRGRTFAICLSVGFVVVWVPSIVAGYFYTGSIVYPELPLHPGFAGCFIIEDKPLVVWCWISLLVWDLISLVMVIIPGAYSYRSGTTSSMRLSYVVYRDGTIYYAFLFGMSLLNIGFSAGLPASARVVTMGLTRCLHSMLASRVLLQLREQSHSTDDLSLTLTSTFVAEDGGSDVLDLGDRGEDSDSLDYRTRWRNSRRSHRSEST